MSYIIYCRKSSEASDRQVLSIESQEKELLGLAERQEAKISKTFRESMSAKQPGRPEFENMIKFIEAHHGSIIFVWKLDRLARNPVDEGKVKWLLQNKTIAKIITPERIYLPDDNALISAVEFGMANQYIRDLSTNVKRGNKTKLEKGELPGLAPFGYLNDKLYHTVIVDENNSHWIKFIFETYAIGTYSLKDLLKLLADKGLQKQSKYKISKAYLHHILTNPFYIGVIRRLGIDYQGKHQPLISEQLFDIVQDVLSGKHHSKKQKLFFPVRGFMSCTCGCLLTASTKKGHIYYYCTNGKGNCLQHKKYLNKDLTDKLVAKVLNEIKFDTEMVEIAYQAAKEKTLTQGSSLEIQKTELAKNLKIEQDKLSNLADIISTDPSLKDSLKGKILSLEASIKSIQQQIFEVENKPEQDPLITLEQTKKAFLQACSASFDYLKADDKQKNELLKILLWNFKVENQEVQSFQLKQPYQLMAQAPKNMDLNQWLGW